MSTCLGGEWWFASWYVLQAPSPPPPQGLQSHKSAFCHSCVHFPALSGDSTWRNRCRDCNRNIHSFSLKDRTGWWQKNKSVLHKCRWLFHFFFFFFYLPKEIMNAPRRCRWRSGSGCGSSTARSALGSAAGSAAQIVAPWKKKKKHASSPTVCNKFHVKMCSYPRPNYHICRVVYFLCLVFDRPGVSAMWIV